jgi:pimeloyl-ACP methyl ester carboxylesterase
VSERFVADDGVAIAYELWGSDRPGSTVVLHHGFGSHAQSNWVATGVVAALEAAGRSVLAVDARGHGASDKPYDAAAYGEQRMARDLLSLCDHLGLDRFDLVGYSMGAVVALIVASTTARARRLVASGVGEGVIECGGVDMRRTSRETLAAALLAADPATIAHPGAAAFRAFVDRTRCDRRALAGQALRMHAEPIALGRISAPTLVLAGAADVISLNPQRLADAIPGAACLTLPGDHLSVAATPAFANAIVAFVSG